MVSLKTRRKQERAAAAIKEQSEKQEELNKRRDEENKQIREQQEKFDEEHQTQAFRARKAGTGKFAKGSRGEKTVTLTPTQDQQQIVTKIPNEHGGFDIQIQQREDLHFSDALTAERIRFTSEEAVRDSTSRAKLINPPSRHAQFLQSGSRESKAIIEFFNQYKSTRPPPKTVIIGFLRERGVTLSPRGEEFVDDVTANKGKLSAFGTSTFFDPKTGERFSARTGEGDIALAQRLGFDVAAQPPSLPAGNNQALPQRTPDVQAIEEFIGSFKSTTRPSKAIIEGVLEEKGIEITPEGQELIKDITANRGRLSNIDTSKFFDPQTAERFDEETGRGSQQLAFKLGKRDEKPPPDPLGISQGLQSGLDFLADKAEQTRKTIDDPNASFQERGKAVIENFQSEFGTAALNIPASFVNLGGSIASNQQGKPPSPQINIPKESTEEIFFRKSFAEPDIATGIKNIPKNLQSTFDESIREKGLVGTLGSTAFAGLTLTPLVQPAKAIVPIRTATLPVKTSTQPAKIIVARVGERIKPIATVQDRKITRGFDPATIDLKTASEFGATRAKGGAELAVLGRTEEVLLSNPKTLRTLVKSGDITQQQAERVTAVKGLVKETKNVPDRPFRQDFTEQPFENIARGRETQVVKDFFKSKNIVLEGSGIDIPTFLPKFASRAGDFDIKLANFRQAQTFSKELTEQLNVAAAGTGRRFEASGGKITLFEGRRKVGKAGEFLSHDDPESLGQLSKTGKVFGVKTSTKTPKTEGIKRKTLQFQIGRRGASVTSLFKGNFQPPINPAGQGAQRAKDLPRLFAGAKSAAEVFRLEGQPQKAARVDAFAETIKRTTKEIDFDEFFATRQKITANFGQQQSRNTVKDIASNLSKPVKQSPSSNVLTSQASFISPSRSITPSPTSSIVSRSLSSMLSPSKSASSFVSASSKSRASKSGASLSKGSKSLLSLSGKSSIYSGKSPMSLTRSSSSSFFGKSPPSITGFGQSPITLTPPKQVITPLKFNREKKKKFEMFEGATQTKVFGVKNPFSDAFSIKERKGGRIEPF